MDTIKENMEAYWSGRVENFSNLRQREFASKKHELWLDEFDRYLPSGQQLKILDIGTGTGFFSFLLAERGHQVTGIDLTPGMIAEARQLAKQMGLAADFYVMDAENPEFPPHSFDAIVTRKLTWTLPNLPVTYRNWHELLKPGGILINFDADYCREKRPELMPKNYADKDVSSMQMLAYEHMKDILRPTQQPRPQWDAQLLDAAGFKQVQIDTQVWDRIYGEEDEFFDPTVGFAITAIA